MKLEIIDFKKIFLIEKNLIFKKYKIKKSSFLLKFIKIKENQIFILNYIILSIYLFNIFIMNNNKYYNEIIKIIIKFQIIKYYFIKFLIKRNILKKYKIIINEDYKYFIFNKS